MILSKELRGILLAITSFGIILTLLKLILDPEAGNKTVSLFAFPPNVPLSEAQLLESKPLNDTVNQLPGQYDSVIAGRRYRYIKNGIFINIEMRYVVGTLGNIDSLLQKHTDVKLPRGEMIQALRQQNEMGFYSLFVYRHQAYLNACINPRGNSTVTMQQFLKNQVIYDLQIRRLRPWLLGEETLRDRRCLWAHLSTPLNATNPESSYQLLEQAWVSWFRWWKPRFPKQ
ncbi:cyanoexosortase A system-associated protein [Trichocoleus sp. FACHB-90]|uniref:cyanoexosortase A system-associated protein n=1 Tax=Cyanophyceae TaxID=3028117 RepID=UPI001682EFD6|nr:cyanoexosortase A system-associated protein [Trichocoleus sp. FACHB-90]MBD1926793.1 cyanoexosortase A system-associated protein [Trichocoleus sp. FACHB-90]